MKRTFLIAFVTLAMAVPLVMYNDAISGEKPQGSRISGSITHTSTVDSTSAVQRDTTSTPSGSSTKLGWFTDVYNYGTVEGWYLIEYTSIDSGPAAANIADTTKDTAIVLIYTADADGTPYKEVWRDTIAVFHVTASVANTDYVAFDVSDSTLWDVLYFQVITSLKDSTYVKARTPTADIQWKTSWRVYGK